MIPVIAEPYNSDIDSAERALLDRLEEEIDGILDQVVESIAGTAGFEPIRDAALPGELRYLARRNFMGYTRSLRTQQAIDPAELEFVGERSAQRAREMIPLAATV